MAYKSAWSNNKLPQRDNRSISATKPPETAQDQGGGMGSLLPPELRQNVAYPRTPSKPPQKQPKLQHLTQPNLLQQAATQVMSAPQTVQPSIQQMTPTVPMATAGVIGNAAAMQPGVPMQSMWAPSPSHEKDTTEDQVWIGDEETGGWMSQTEAEMAAFNAAMAADASYDPQQGQGEFPAYNPETGQMEQSSGFGQTDEEQSLWDLIQGASAPPGEANYTSPWMEEQLAAANALGDVDTDAYQALLEEERGRIIIANAQRQRDLTKMMAARGIGSGGEALFGTAGLMGQRGSELAGAEAKFKKMEMDAVNAARSQKLGALIDIYTHAGDMDQAEKASQEKKMIDATLGQSEMEIAEQDQTQAMANNVWDEIMNSSGDESKADVARAEYWALIEPPPHGPGMDPLDAKSQVTQKYALESK